MGRFNVMMSSWLLKFFILGHVFIINVQNLCVEYNVHDDNVL